MTYPALRAEFDSLALDIFENGPTMLHAELIARVQELCGLALLTIAATKDGEDSQDVAGSICAILHRAYSLSNSVEQASYLRQRLPYSKMREMDVSY